MKIEIDTKQVSATLLQAIISELGGAEAPRQPDPRPEPKSEPETKSPPPSATATPQKSIFKDSSPPPPKKKDIREDTFGVIYDPEFCANAKSPFFTSGPRKGQWKKRVGVTEEDYDAWYASRRPDAGEYDYEDEDGEHVPTEVDTSSAFGSPQQAQPAQQPAPQDAGSFFQWLSVKQANGDLNAQDIAHAYSAAGVNINDLFPPNDHELVKTRIASVYGHLVGKAGA